jgi:D-alanine-D-alanine ligase/UDP-N-acetylmuramate--alanine ligase
MVLYNREMIDRLRASAPDMVFVCVQGKGHGDGTAQSILDFLGFPYTGSRATAAAIINNKIICKELFSRAGIPTPAWRTLTQAAFRAGGARLSGPGFPFAAKAPSQGGSFGIELIKTESDLPRLENVFVYDDPILLESFVRGAFATVGLLERGGRLEAFPPVTKVSRGPGAALSPPPRDEIVLRDSDRYVFAACDFPPALTEKLLEYAAAAFAATRARGYARVDFMVADESPFILEINAVPGLKDGSLFPFCASLAGAGIDEVIKAIVQEAAESK